MVVKETYTVCFVTPGFVGGADQTGEWRTPPFKALLRRWWRIVWWNQTRNRGETPNIDAMRQAEGRLFGCGADEGGGARASRVRLQLNRWGQGSLTADAFNRIKFPKVEHGEVKDPKTGGPREVASSLYLGYGAVNFAHGSARLVRQAAIAPAPQEDRRLHLIYPTEEQTCIRDALKLVTLFGATGGRSRNGWGSLWLVPDSAPQEAWLPLQEILDPKEKKARDWLRALSCDLLSALGTDWCHCLGRDAKGLLLWVTSPEESWEAVLKIFAEVKIKFRTKFHFKGAGPHKSLCDRQIIAYPVTNHTLSAWGKNARHANQIIFKVLPDGDGYRGLVVHLPHGLPKVLKDRLDPTTRETLRDREIQVWSKVHETLDAYAKRDQKLYRLA